MREKETTCDWHESESDNRESERDNETVNNITTETDLLKRTEKSAGRLSLGENWDSE